MVWRLRLALSQLGTRQSLGQHRLRRRRQGLQAQDRDYRFHIKERHRFDVKDGGHQERLDDQVKERSGHKVFRNQVLIGKRKRSKVIRIFSDQGRQDSCDRIDRKVQRFKVGCDHRQVFRSRFRNNKVHGIILRTFIFRNLQQAFHYLQQTFHFQQHPFRKLFFRQWRKLQVIQCRFLRQQLPQLFIRQLFFR